MFRFTSRFFAASEVISALKILGLREGANAADVRASYLRLAKSHHPDLEGGDDSKMKIINVAYETLQLHGTGSTSASSSNGGGPEEKDDGKDASPSSRYNSFRQGSQRMANLVDDEFDTWTGKTDLDWTAALKDIPAAEVANPANNPHAYSRFFSLEDDVTIYKMLRSGATIPQVSRALRKPATFVGKRVHNAQFKLRIQHVLRREKRGEIRSSDPLANNAAGVTIRKPKHAPQNSSEAWEEMRENNTGPNLNVWTAKAVDSNVAKNYRNYLRFNKMKG